MELSFYSVISFRERPVGVLLIGHTGCYWQTEDLSLLPDGARRFLLSVYARLSERHSVRELRRLAAQLEPGPTRLTEPMPVTFQDPEPMLDNLAKRFLRPDLEALAS